MERLKQVPKIITEEPPYKHTVTSEPTLAKMSAVSLSS